MREDLYTKLHENGFLIIENFLTDEEVFKLKEAGTELSISAPTNEPKIVFTTTKHQQACEKYFIESGDKIRYFYEKAALDDKGNLRVSPEIALNKIGHNLHWLHPTFKELSFGKKVEQLCRQLRFEAPVILQSMYIYKNPGIGSTVSPHQDSTYFNNEPDTLMGLWFPIDDATLENGCLWFIPGSHENGTHRRFIRNPDTTSKELLIFDKPPTIYPSSSFVPFPTPKGSSQRVNIFVTTTASSRDNSNYLGILKKWIRGYVKSTMYFLIVAVKFGSCVVIHGNVVHKSDPNKSSKSRHAYTFHFMEASSKYSPDNWLQSTNGFPLIYSD